MQLGGQQQRPPRQWQGIGIARKGSINRRKQPCQSLLGGRFIAKTNATVFGRLIKQIKRRRPLTAVQIRVRAT